MLLAVYVVACLRVILFCIESSLSFSSSKKTTVSDELLVVVIFKAFST